MELVKISSNRKRICFVGEGNFSFCHFLCQNENVEHKNILATCYEPEPISDTAQDNIEDLKAKGVQIKMNFDATKMDVYDIGRFDLVIFMFPHIGNFSTLQFDRKKLNFFFLSKFFGYFVNSKQTLQFDGKIKLLNLTNFSREIGFFPSNRNVEKLPM